MRYTLLCALAFAAGCSAGPQDAAAPAAPPNVLWITAEDMSSWLGCWGDPYARTPHLDRLAKESVRYVNAFATAPVCSPARSCLITGLYATSLGTQRLRSRFPLPASVRGWPSYLRKRGYYCTNNVKTDYNTSDEGRLIAESWDASSPTAHWRGRAAGQPFFAVFNDMTTHQSRSTAWPRDQFEKEVQSRLAPGEIHDPAEAPVPPYYPATETARRTVARHYDCITVMDKNVGRILAQLEEDGLADDTVVFFFSDHGAGLPRHKRLLHDSGLRVPLLVRFPPKYRHLAPAAPGATLDRLVSFVDFPATVLSLLGIPAPDALQGTAFLGSDAGSARRYVFGARDRVDEAFDLARSVRDARWLYIRTYLPHLSYNQPSWYSDQSPLRREIERLAAEDALKGAARHYGAPTRPREELYDTAADPHQTRNLAGDPGYGPVLERLRTRLRKWIAETRDLGFLPESEAWSRSGEGTPVDVARDPARYPLERILDAADLVGRGEDAVPLMIGRLSDPDAAVRTWAATALAALGPRAAPVAGAIENALRDASPAVRIEAAGALARTGRVDRALPVLLKELFSEDLDVALHACRTIELLGAAARDAAPAMRAIRERSSKGEGDRHMFLRFSTDAFLRRLGA